MSELRKLLASIDDEYLIGMSNKGILKRSHKDLEAECPEIVETEQGILGRWEGVEVCLKLPLTESTCTCPSHGTCKHVIMTILAAKRAQETGGAQGPSEAASGQGAAAADGEKGAVNVAGGQETSETASRQVVSDAREGGGESESQRLEFDVSLDVLRKAVSEKEFCKIAEELKNGPKLQILYGAMVTVREEEAGTVVKLTTPLEHSSCTCHNQKLCRHKVKAILALLLEQKKVTRDELDAICSEAGEQAWDLEAIEAVLSDLRDLFRELLMVGSARLSAETADSLERMAIRCHGAGLAELEGKLRALSDAAKGYQGRRSGVTALALMRRFTAVYGITQNIESAMQKGAPLSEVVGEFRSKYQDVPKLCLAGMGMRQFVSPEGFEGKTLYFLEERTGEWYTYTMVRPTIYENKARRYVVSQEVPWGLPCTLAQLAYSRIVLKDGKANADHRLSSTSQASAEFLGQGKSESYAGFEKNVFDDFEELWKAYLARVESRRKTAGNGMEDAGELSETEKLFLVKPRGIREMRYDETLQQLIFYLEDGQGRRLKGQLTYSKQEAAAIRSLERLERNLKQKDGEVPIFLGTLYVEDGECVLYPIETVEA